MSTIAPEIEQQWLAIAPYLTINNEQEYKKAVARLNTLIDEVGVNEEHPLYSLLNTLGILIETYEKENYEIPDCSGVDMLLYFMEEYSLTKSDLPEIGSAKIISEIINGEQELNIRHVKALAERFKVDSSVFL